MEPVRDNVVPKPKWEFDQDVTNAFDDMFARSIPDYDVMRKACFDLGSRFVKPKTDIVDLGCARGGALQPFVDRFGAHNRFIGVEISQPMVEAARERFRGYIDCGVVSIRDDDLRRVYPPASASLTLAVMTIQFTPIEYRQQIVQGVFDHTIPGGGFILAEKILGRDDRTNRLLVDVYHDVKRANGYTDDDIARKKLSLEGVLVPVTAAWNEDLLRAAGFAHVECFWRFANFAAWVAIR